MTFDRHQIWHTDREYEDGDVWLPCFFDDFMRNSDFSRVLHVKRQLLTHFLWRHFSARSSFYCFIWYGIQRGVYKKILHIFYASVFVIGLYLQKAMYRPCDLDRWHMKVNFFVVNLLWPNKCPVWISDRYIY